MLYRRRRRRPQQNPCPDLISRESFLTSHAFSKFTRVHPTRFRATQTATTIHRKPGRQSAILCSAMAMPGHCVRRCCVPTILKLCKVVVVTPRLQKKQDKIPRAKSFLPHYHFTRGQLTSAFMGRGKGRSARFWPSCRRNRWRTGYPWEKVPRR